jgi:hypothetical protein
MASLLAEDRYTLRFLSGREAGEYTGRAWELLEFRHPFFLKKSNGQRGPEHERDEKTKWTVRHRWRRAHRQLNKTAGAAGTVEIKHKARCGTGGVYTVLTSSTDEFMGLWCGTPLRRF